jgi:hypothetical protein
MGSDEIQQRTEVTSQPDRNRRYEVGQYLRVGYKDAMLGALKPNLESVPGFDFRSSFTCFFWPVLS